jgi:UDP-N-acetyl-D-galactosamine dehydrogenase
VDVVDPHADSEELQHEYGFSLVESPNGQYDAVVVAVAHEPYKSLGLDYFNSISRDKTVLVDLKSLYNGLREHDGLVYWSL